MNIYIIKRLVYLSPFANLRLVHLFRYKRTIGWIKETVSKFGRDPEDVKLMSQIRNAYVEYHWNALEYFLFDYENSSVSRRREFCPEYDHNIFCLRVNNFSTAKLFRDKLATYKRFEKYFKRRCVYVESASDFQKEEVKSFLIENTAFLAKPVGACCGQGIKKYTSENISEFVEYMHQVQSGGYLLEPYLHQVPEMAVLHPESLNTLRIPTINYGDHIEVFHPFLRIGRGSCFVDNAGAGGVVACLDPSSGEVLAAGDENGNSFIYHPDTNVKLIGFKVPDWDAAVKTAMSFAKEVPDVHHVGWDLALTENGWVMIEGNEDGQFVTQYFDHKGVAEEVSRIIKTLRSSL